MNKTDLVERPRLRRDIPPFRPGDTVRVHVKVAEAGRERVQVFEGVVIRRRGSGLNETFSVRKISYGVGVERNFPVHAPVIDKVEITQHGRVRRSKLYYLRERTGRHAKIRERRTRIAEFEVPEEPEELAPAEAAAEEAPVAEVEAEAPAEAEAAEEASPEAPAAEAPEEPEPADKTE